MCRVFGVGSIFKICLYMEKIDFRMEEILGAREETVTQ